VSFLSDTGIWYINLHSSVTQFAMLDKFTNVHDVVDGSYIWYRRLLNWEICYLRGRVTTSSQITLWFVVVGITDTITTIVVTAVVLLSLPTSVVAGAWVVWSVPSVTSCVCVRTVKGKWLELSIPNLVHQCQLSDINAVAVILCIEQITSGRNIPITLILWIT